MTQLEALDWDHAALEDDNVSNSSLLQDIHKGDGLKNPINRVYSTNAAEPWHVDDADVVGQSILLAAGAGTLWDFCQLYRQCQTI